MKSTHDRVDTKHVAISIVLKAKTDRNVVRTVN
jgi:hypothetical protein